MAVMASNFKVLENEGKEPMEMRMVTGQSRSELYIRLYSQNRSVRICALYILQLSDQLWHKWKDGPKETCF